MTLMTPFQSFQRGAGQSVVPRGRICASSAVHVPWERYELDVFSRWGCHPRGTVFGVPVFGESECLAEVVFDCRHFDHRSLIAGGLRTDL